MTFAEPLALLPLALALALVIWVGWPRVRYRRGRDTASLIARLIIVLCLGLVLAGLQVVREVDRLAVVFLLDASDSIGVEGREAQLAFVRAAVAEKQADDKWALIVFGANASIDQPFTAVADALAPRSAVRTNQTNLAEAIQTAISLFPADARRRIVLLSDGRETLGDAVAKAQLAQASGVEISYVPLVRSPLPDVRISELDAPSRVIAGQEFDVRIAIEAEVATQATLLLFSGNSLIQEETINLPAGTTRYTVPRTSEQSGFLNFSARIVAPATVDAYSQNNELATFTQVVGSPRVLVIADDADELVNLLPALRSAGIDPEVRAPASLPADVAAFADYRSILIVNTPATAFTERQMTLIDRSVRDLGTGLIMIGGPESYGPGGYYQTPLEATLPVETQIKDQQRIPQLTIVYLIDRSGSMGVTDANGIPNIELAKRAINLSIDLLQPTDRAGVATFDTGGAWVADIQDIADRRQLQALVGTLRSGGGTDILAGLRLAQRSLREDESPRKHLILLTDGEASPNQLVETVTEMRAQNDVTTSVVALGQGRSQILPAMAEAGEGNYHQVLDLSQIPNIFTLETVLATRSYIFEQPFTPVRAISSPLIDGLTATPDLYGYVATTPRSLAQVVLTGPEPFRDPLLAAWQYGLGRSVAFTSDATARWASDWVSWDGFARFWGQIVNWTITEGTTDNLEVQVEMLGERARIIADGRSATGAFINGLQLTANVLMPDGTAQRVALQQIAPGRYEATFIPASEGAYFVAVTGEGLVDGQPQTFSEINGWVMGYSAEYDQGPADERLLARLASLTNGQNLVASPAGAFAQTQAPRTATAPVAPWLLLLALCLLPVDVAIRRLLITQSDLRRLRAWLSGGSGLADDRISTLRAARDRARDRHVASDALDAVRQRGPASPLDDAPPPAGPGAVRRPAGPPAQGDTVGALLKRKRGDGE